MHKNIMISLLLILGLVSCSKSSSNTNTPEPANPTVTLVELGSERCIPCRRMTAVLDAVRKKYPTQVRVVFHDVWKDRHPAKQYGIRVIPTQVFLDKNGVEYFRHEGYFPLEEVEKILKRKI